MIFIFLSSGLFLGWSLGANDAANVFGTAVGSKMVRFKTAAIIASIFIILGAVISGSGATHTLGKLGAVNAIAGSFMVAFSAAFTVFWMTKLKLPVSTSQAIVGAIIGWNLFSGSLTDYNSLTKIVMTWVLCPVLSAVIAIILFSIVKFYLNHSKIHLLRVDIRTRVGLILVGAFASYSLGANNIANVMGVFVPVSPIEGLSFYGLFSLSGTQILFLLGGVAIGFGVLTYSYKVMDTVGGSLMKLSPVAALVIVLSQAIVLFLFSSEMLESFLINHGLPAIPLVPVSSSQAVIGAVIGIGILKGGKGIRYKVLGEIASGWVTTPIIAGIITFVALFFLQNVFNQEVYRPVTYVISDDVLSYLDKRNVSDEVLVEFKGKEYCNAIRFESDLKLKSNLNSEQRTLVVETARAEKYYIDLFIMNQKIDGKLFTAGQYQALERLSGKTFQHQWQFSAALEVNSEEWKFKEASKVNKIYNKDIKLKRKYLFNIFKAEENDTE